MEKAAFEKLLAAENANAVIADIPQVMGSTRWVCCWVPEKWPLDG